MAFFLLMLDEKQAVMECSTGVWGEGMLLLLLGEKGGFLIYHFFLPLIIFFFVTPCNGYA